MTKKELEQKTDSFVSTYLGQSKGYPDDSQYWGQCLSIVKLYIKEVFGISPPPSGTNSAYGYWSNFPSPLDTVFERVLNTIDVIPEYGWIAVWKPWTSNPRGHIAIVAKGSTKSILKNYAQNWTSKTFQLESNRYTNVVGFLKPIKVLEDNMTDEEARILKFVREQNATEGDVRAGIGYVRDKTVERLETDVKSLKTQVNDLIKRTSEQDLSIKELSQKLKEAQQSIDNYQTDLKTANSKITRLEKQIETKEQELVASKEVANKYQRLYKEALDKSAEKLTSWELLKLFVKKISWKK